MSSLRVTVIAWMFSLTWTFGPTLAQSSSVTSTKWFQARPGARIAWLAVGRERVQEHMENRRSAGLASAGVDGKIEINVPVTDQERLRLAVVDMDLGKPGRVPERAGSEEEVLTLSVAPGASWFVVHAGEIDLIYARKNVHAWLFHAHDGGSQDGDGVANGEIVVSLSSMESLLGNIQPPNVIEPGDVIAAIEPRTLRTADEVIP